MHSIQSLLQLVNHRAQLLVPVLAVSFFLSDYVAWLSSAQWLGARVDQAAGFLLRKLDKPKRSIGTRVYRGIIALAFLLIPAIILGTILGQPKPWAQILSLLLLTGLIGRAFLSIRLFRYWRQAHRHTLPLELPERNYLFADSHALLRYLILDSGERFAVGVVGASFWYLVGGIELALCYLLIAELAARWASPLFGWASHALFRLLDTVPRALSWVLLILAGIFVPRTHPLAALRARSFHGLLAYLLGISLGGTLPGRELPWAGSGTPKLLPPNLLRWMLVRLVATVILLLACAGPDIYKLLIIIK